MTEVTSPRGEIREGAAGERTLTFRRRFPDPIDDVWSAVTDSERLARWFGSYEGEGVAGSTVMVTITAPEDAGGDPWAVQILECEPPHRLVLDIPESDGSAWHIAMTLSEDSDATVLVFQQTVPPGFNTADTGPGWHWYLDRLTAVLAELPMPDWADYPALAPVYS